MSREDYRVDYVTEVSVGSPHVVLLGAGASRAAFPRGDRDGRRLPLMNDFVAVIPGVSNALSKFGIDFKERNFEEIYSCLHGKPELRSLCQELEELVFSYFSSLRLHDRPTLYDYLILSLRPKDIIACFNWDPFLIQAVMRHRYEPPLIAFLHGNVMAGYCARDDMHGVIGSVCSKCHERMNGVPLLYPIESKDYESHNAIRGGWELAKFGLKHASRVTVFGYGAPQSDQGAIALLQDAWGNWEDRNMEQFELIDIEDRDILRQRWQGFIHTHHYEIHKSFSQSSLGVHPRRSCEAWWNTYFMCKFLEECPPPKFSSFIEMDNWYAPMIDAEEKSEYTKSQQ